MNSEPSVDASRAQLVPQYHPPCWCPTSAGYGIGHPVPSFPPFIPPPCHSSESTPFPTKPAKAPTLVFQGWTYAMDFPATYTKDKKWNSCVRRRKWIRYRRYKSRDTWAKVFLPQWSMGVEHRVPDRRITRIGIFIHPPHGSRRGCHTHPRTWLLICLLPSVALKVPSFGRWPHRGQS